jgi:BirA family transcriptional regulator, biotin operon repressor / biotin---[acetyl-CoA-carboxylase] ligase
LSGLVRKPAAGGEPAGERSFISRQRRFERVGSTNDVMRAWLAEGTPEVCLVVADEQSAGRGRDGRRWQAPAGTGFLCSLGFRPTWLAPDRAWRLAAIVSLALADAAEEVGGLADRSIRLKWPNDLVIEAGGGVAKLGGLLGETIGLGTLDPRVIIGLGLNADWLATDFPPELAHSMTSLRVASNGRPVDLPALFAAFIDRVEIRTIALRAGHFDVADWVDRQLTRGRPVRLELPDGTALDTRALGVDVGSGGLVIEDLAVPAGERIVLTGEIRHLRLPAGV